MTHAYFSFVHGGRIPCCYLNYWHGNLACTIQQSTDLDRLVTDRLDLSTTTTTTV